MHDGDLWVFAYGSLIWNPGFVPAEAVKGEVAGYHRSFCLQSIHYRGTPERPGLVLALDADPRARCEGLIYRVEAAQAVEVLAYLRERELISYAYEEAWLEARPETGGAVTAVTYVISPDNVQYRGGLDLAAQADVIATAGGPRGSNADYLFNTMESLAGLGIVDAELRRLETMVRARLAARRSETGAD